eukprot:897677-Amphidinium_carterae.1
MSHLRAPVGGCVDWYPPGSLSPAKCLGQSFLKVLDKVLSDLNPFVERDTFCTGWLLSGWYNRFSLG